MRALTRKLFRDLNNMRAMVVVIALMIVSGVATYITLVSTLYSLKDTQELYYQDYYFSHVFASLKRAPLSVVPRIREIPGVNRVEARIFGGASLEMEEFDELMRGLVISLPDEGEPLLNRLHLREGRMPAPYTPDEAVVGDAFAQAHGLRAGNRLTATLNGRRREIEVVGIGLSPEFIIQSDPGSVVPDFERFAILWMARTSLEAAYDMEGAFNNVTASLTFQANEAEVIRRLDEILRPYGGLGATGRMDQQSHFYITEEFRQLGQMATIIPAIFLGVAAFLLNVVIGRLIQTQQGQIATLKAFGYRNREIGWHYIFMVSFIAVLGLAAGVLLGMYLGELLAGVYARYYRFPFLEYHLGLPVFLSAAAVSFGAALAGVLMAVRRAVLLPPAQGMLAEPPGTFRPSLLERMGLEGWFDQPTRMILRQISRHPWKTAFSVIGIGFAASLVMVGRMSEDSVSYAVEVEFRRAQPYDISVSFVEAISSHAIIELKRIPGVYLAEGWRGVPVRLRNGHLEYLTGLQAWPRERKLKPLLDTEHREVPLPAEGVVLTAKLGEILRLQQGDTVTVEVLEHGRQVLQMPVTGFMDQYFGLGGYIAMDVLDRVIGEPDLVSGAWLMVDRDREEEIQQTLRKSPRVGGVESMHKIIERFYESTAQTWLILSFFVSLFAMATAFSVVYNNARISLSERNRELASLRVLGFTRGEIAYILLGELWVTVLIAIPVGFVLGTGLTAFIVWSLQTNLYRIPFYISDYSYALAALVIIISGLLSGALLRSRINRLDLIEVLKTRE